MIILYDYMIKLFNYFQIYIFSFLYIFFIFTYFLDNTIQSKIFFLKSVYYLYIYSSTHHNIMNFILLR